jgi:RimJ/RimL family protein N-acetyltransferase
VPLPHRFTGGRVMTRQRVVVAELREKDLPFLLALWHTSEVMRYADEFPRLRGWSRSDDLQTAWATYLEKCDRKNPAAQRVYEKAGFELYKGMRSWRNHKVMTLSREAYEGIDRGRE